MGAGDIVVIVDKADDLVIVLKVLLANRKCKCKFRYTHIGVDRNEVALKKMVDSCSKQHSILNRVDRSSRLRLDSDPVTIVMLSPVALICEWKDMCSLKAHLVPNFSTTCTHSSYNIATISLTYSSTKFLAADWG